MKFQKLLWVVSVCTWLAACSDDTVSQRSNNTNTNNRSTNNQVECVDEDGDGLSPDLRCEGGWDCDDTNPDIGAGAEDVCFDAVDNDCDGDVDEDCPECPEGATAPCGIDMGECSPGVQTCRDGVWSVCEGGVQPTGEVCNGLDDDCDGETDEDPERICRDESVCNGSEMCVEGQCEAGEPIDCSNLDDVCTIGECNDKDGQCRVVFRENGTPCDDGNFCTVAGTCQAGVCESEARDCGGETDQCNLGVCDEATDACIKQPVSDGTGCDDGAYCTINDVCSAGTCGGATRDCSSLTNQCNVGSCDETADSCVAQARPNDTPCDDGLYCTAGDACQAGSCVAGPPRVCGAAGGSCRTGVCDETLDMCTGDPVPNGSACDDGQFCTLNDFCVAGTCAGGTARTCAGTSCTDGYCDDVANSCLTTPKADGTVCNDGAFCTISDSCTTGVCGGMARDCSSASDACNTGICNEAADSCVGQPKSDGTACPDGNFCTVNDVCQAGTCATQPRDCTSANDSCNVGVCNEGADACQPVARPNGTMCNDGQFCTTSDSCVAGSCVGSARDCSAAGGECTVGTCNEITDQCSTVPKADGTSCDDGQWCTPNDSCIAGTCSGPPRSCNGAADNCNQGVCDEAADACTSDPLPDGTGCSDMQFCTVNDVCTAGTCSGMARDCDGVGDECNLGVCNESSDSCEQSPKPNGSSCDDQLFCTDGDVCLAGSCISGAPYNCSSSAGVCEIASCNEMTNSCDVSPDPVCCDPMVDQDVDGSNECDDCDDTNGAVYPGAMERCNGVDDDCDGLIDEDFDVDGDLFSVCSTDPGAFDCDDTNPLINPGANENCGVSGNGNGLDDNCNGYIDEGCGNCQMLDTDGDGVSECDGDCQPNDSTVYPGAPEFCDGKDNDCNTYTRPNCGVSESCNQDGDGNFDNDPDICGDEMICACLLNGRNCTGNYRCTSFCNSSETGPIGDGCQANQTCALDLLYSANVHGCQVNSTTPGVLGGGEYCSGDSDCRSLQCDKPCNGPGCNNKICYDLCTHDERCGTNAVCRMARTSSNLDGRCWPSGGPFLGSTAVGATCTADSNCDRGLCLTDPNDSTRYCTEGCCKDADCPSGYTCSLSGESAEANVVYTPPGASTCTTNAQCAGEGGYCFNGSCGWRIVETAGQCVKDVNTPTQVRPPGAACTTNSQCESNFCDDDLSICISSCCADTDCLVGQECVLQFVQTDTERATQARVCMSISTEEVLQRK